MNIDLKKFTSLDAYTREVRREDLVPGEFYKAVYPAETEQPPDIIRYVAKTTPSSIVRISDLGLSESDPLLETYVRMSSDRSLLPKIYKEPTDDTLRDIYYPRAFTRDVRTEYLIPGKLYYNGDTFIIPLSTSDKSMFEYLLVGNTPPGPSGTKYYESPWNKRKHLIHLLTQRYNTGSATSVGGYRRRRKQTRRQHSRRHRKTRHLNRRSS